MARGDGAQQCLEQRILLTATLCLLAFGAVMVYSASSTASMLEGGGAGTSLLVKFLIFGAVGLVVMQIAARRGIALVPRYAEGLLALAFVLTLAVHLPHFGVSVNGARRWIGVGPLQFEPSELMKLALVLYAATLLARRPRRVRSLSELARPLLWVAGAACLLVVSEPDIGSAMVIAFSLATMLIVAGIAPGKLAKLGGGLLLLVFIYALLRPYARARLTSFIDPWAHASTTGFQEVQAQVAVGSGGLFGVGPGQSVQKAFFLPEASTDFIFAVVGEELGVLGASALLSLYGMIAYAGLRTARRARSLYSALIAVGCTAMIVSQAMLNVFSVLGLAPLTGVPLPFVSYGSSSMVVMLAAIGLLMGVAGGASAHVRGLPQPRLAGGGRSRKATGSVHERKPARSSAAAERRRRRA